MTTFTEICDEVYTLTSRPDLVADTKAAVKAATLWAHGADFMPKDLYEVPITWDSAKFLQEFNYKSEIPRWRALSYLRKFDFASDTPGEFFDILEPQDVLDQYGADKPNVCYLAGVYLKVRSTQEFSGALLGCYVHPNVTEGGYSSWIADENMWPLVYKAASTVFKVIGLVERANGMESVAMEHLASIVRSNILAEGS